MTSRRYSEKTIKILFGASGNTCAHPGCTHNIIAPETPYSDAAVVAQICHIHSAADNGPRPNPDLTEAERNAPANLILMCGHHHPSADKQWETYPADLLLKWKKEHEAKYQEGTAEALKLQESMQQLSFLRAYSDKEIEAEIERIRKGRFLFGFPTTDAALQFAERVERTELAGGSRELRARALAWCARLLAFGETQERAKALLVQSKALASTDDALFAEAAILAITDRAAALSLLAQKDTPSAKAAALRIMTNSAGPEGALAWTDAAGLTLGSFNGDGKNVLIMNKISAGRWDDAAADTAALTDADFDESPVLHSPAAMSWLAQAVPEELRLSATSQVPFHSREFRLKSDDASMNARRQAVVHFEKISTFAASVGAQHAADLSAQYALWLRLRDPIEQPKALDDLRAGMRDASKSLRLLHLALDFGIKIDVAAVESEIDRSTALSGIGTSDGAYARFRLAFTKGGPKNAAAYIAKHRAQLYEHLQKVAVLAIEIEMLSQAGEVETAKERLAEAVAAELDPNEIRRLERSIAEADGADPAAARRTVFEQSGSLFDLNNLINLLEEKGRWEELCPLAEKLFESTQAIEDAVRFGAALNETGQYDKLYAFALAHRTLADQSASFKMMLAWSHFRHGAFGDARKLLGELLAVRDDANDRALSANLAIASGHWDDLVDFCSSEWSNREQRTARELLLASQLAHAVGAPHVADLIREAVAKAPDDPGILMAAYYTATNAGLEQNQETGWWLTRAAELSGDDGPVKSVSMKELMEMKPDWDKRGNLALQHLNEGKMPAFGAAFMLNRSFTDFVLLQPFANQFEADPRRRSVVYAYSGARPEGAPPPFNSIALDLGAIFTLVQLDLLGAAIETYEHVLISGTTLSWLFQEKQKAAFHQPSQIREAHYLKRLIADGALKVLPEPPLSDMGLAHEVGVGLAGMLLASKARRSSQAGAASYVIRSAPVHRLGSLLEEEADLTAYADQLRSCQAVVQKLREKGILTQPEESRAVSYLKVHERRWSGEEAIADGAELYLDELSVAYLQTIGVLGKLRMAGLTAYIPEDHDKTANRLIAFESLSATQIETIEAVRKILSDGIDSGRVRAAKTREREGENPLKNHPTMSVLGLEETVDALVVDDRYINRHPFMEFPDRRTPVITSLDLLDDLAARGVITKDDVLAHRINLRRAGLQLIPVRSDELIYHVRNAPLSDGAVVETAELKAIRESLLKARMSRMLQIPLEAPWLLRSGRAMADCVHEIWKNMADKDEAAARSNWVLDLSDVRGWAPSAIPGTERNFGLYMHAAHIQPFFTPPGGVSNEVKEAYHDWIEDQVLAGIKETQPEVFAWLIDRAGEIILQAADNAGEEGES